MDDDTKLTYTETREIDVIYDIVSNLFLAAKGLIEDSGSTAASHNQWHEAKGRMKGSTLFVQDLTEMVEAAHILATIEASTPTNRNTEQFVIAQTLGAVRAGDARGTIDLTLTRDIILAATDGFLDNDFDRLARFNANTSLNVIDELTSRAINPSSIANQSYQALAAGLAQNYINRMTNYSEIDSGIHDLYEAKGQCYTAIQFSHSLSPILDAAQNAAIADHPRGRYAAQDVVHCILKERQKPTGLAALLPIPTIENLITIGKADDNDSVRKIATKNEQSLIQLQKPVAPKRPRHNGGTFPNSDLQNG